MSPSEFWGDEHFDRGRLADSIPWPDLRGARCLDIGTADGFWAFEMERRGAAEVLATDRPSYYQQRTRALFDAVDSNVRYEERSVYDLEGDFDVAFMGYVLQVLEEPVRALRSVARVARTLVLLDTISLPLALLPSPLARLDARRDGGEWFVFNPRGMRKIVELAGWKVEAQSGILRDPWETSWKGRVGIRGRASALRARRAE